VNASANSSAASRPMVERRHTDLSTDPPVGWSRRSSSTWCPLPSAPTLPLR
jgi:hypothetical protein